MSVIKTAQEIFDVKRAGNYGGRRAVPATMHGKEAAILPALRNGLGLIVEAAQNLDTDVLGTFTGEIPRVGTIRDAAVAKARLGMAATGLPIGIASEGSYGPHPYIPFIPAGTELMVLVDDERGIIVTEHLIDSAPNFSHTYVTPSDDLTAFLDRIGFPDHALIVKSTEGEPVLIHKGLQSRDDLGRAIAQCAVHSRDGRALVQTDMREHMNKTRMATLGRLALALAERLATPCPSCTMPGYGQVDVETGLPCEWCGAPSIMVRYQILGCVACEHRDKRSRADGRTHADPGHCPLCNP